jgi:hypothetical protein
MVVGPDTGVGIGAGVVCVLPGMLVINALEVAKTARSGLALRSKGFTI